MACGRTIQDVCLRLCGPILLIAALGTPCRAVADPIKASLKADVSGGYARLVFSMSDDVDAAVRIADNVMIISFEKPIDVSVDRLAAQAPGYIGAARRDPDGKAIRVALAQKLKVNSISADEKLFVDLLPDSWDGDPPSLPQDVILDLARRAREADRLERQERIATQQKKFAPVRVHVATQPTFTRYVFDIPDQTAVSADRFKDRLALTFDAPLTFDLADANATLPRAIGAINADAKDASAVVSFNFLTKVDSRTFRDGKSYVVDIVGANANPSDESEAPASPQQDAAPPTTPPPKIRGDASPGDIDALAAMLQKRNLDAAAKIAAQGPHTPSPAQPLAQPAPPPHAKSVEAKSVEAKSVEAKSVEKADAQPIPVAPPSLPAATVPPLEQPRPPALQQAAAVPPSAPAAPIATKTEVAPTKTELPVAVAPPPVPAPVDAAKDHATARNGDASRKVAVELVKQGATLKLSFPFVTPTAAAVFNRADTLWIVFDSKDDIDLTALQGESSHTIRDAVFTRAPDADIVRIKLNRPYLSSVVTEGPVWTVELGDSILDPTRALDISRNMIGPNRASITVPFAAPHQLHRIADPEVGDQLLVVTAFAPARGFINTQDFIEFRALVSTQGVVIEPLADDINMELASDKVVISRPNGLTLSSSLQTVLRGSALRRTMFDSQIWGSDRQASYTERQSLLLAAAASAPDNMRAAPRLDLARFYIARDMYSEAKGVLDVALADDRPNADDVSATVLRAVAEIMMNRPEDALKDLADPAVGDQHDAPLWRALAYAGEGKWAQARDGFKRVDASLATLPIELQRVALKDEMRASIEVHDFAGAENMLDDFATLGVPHDMEPAMAILIGRLAEGTGRPNDALKAYRTAADSWDRPAAAQGRLRETMLRYALGELNRAAVIDALESLTTVWRGDETEVEALQILARLYTEDGRYRDSFYVMRSAMAAHPDSDLTRKIQEEAAKTFDSLFLAGKGDSMPAIDALALFYDFRELTPIGRRGDEMIRRLADRLVSVDLLDQAADLLQYQVDKRLQGAARAQVAARLAVIYLMNRKADRALATLRATHTADVSNALRNQRLLLEARALSDMGRHDLALDVISNVDKPEATRLRSDILWAARRWRESAEQIELLYGDRWKQWQPLNDIERSDILRAEVGYALAEDKLGLGRFREKYAAKMAQTPDAHAFQVVSEPLGKSSAEFGEIAHQAASVDTLERFVRDMSARYPDAGETAPPNSHAPATRPAVSAEPDAAPTPPARAAGRTAQR